jgi:hypothetical protein
LLEFNPDVASFESQPVEIRYRRDSGRECRGYPDFLAQMNPGRSASSELYDVKYIAEIRQEWADLRPRFRAAAAYARSRGWIYRIRTDKHIRGPELLNGKRLLRYLREEPDPIHEQLLLDCLREMDRSTPQELLLKSYGSTNLHAQALPTLWCLFAHGKVKLDLSSPITMQSLIWSKF